tara:strand:+ start:6274 stop:6840 length:567 start_codon:yes stop_codon:yes gene_type:complete
MATFPNIEPSFSVKKEQKPITTTVTFVDGFEQRLMFGLPNFQNPRKYNLRWENITEEEADTIDYFLQERAFDKATFDYVPPREAFTKTGTYSQSSTDITITITNHRLFAGDSIVIDFLTGSATDGTYIVSSLVSANAFIVTAASGSASGNVTITKTGSSKFICDSWTKTINVANLADIDAVFVEKFEP